MSDIKDTSTNHADDELSFDEFEPFDEVSPNVSTARSTTTPKQESAGASFNASRSFDNLNMNHHHYFHSV